MKEIELAIKVTFVAVFMWLPCALFAQFYQTGSDPARLDWRYVDAGGFRVIYPNGHDTLAFRYANLLETETCKSLDGLNAGFSSEQARHTFGSRGQIPVVLHAFSSNQNGMVVWAPRRMEFYTIPSAEGTAHEWARSLAVHEGRHVAQMQKSGEHLFKGLHYVLGEQSEGISSAVLDFFSPGLLEGDAVWAETRYSNAGRGRQASFLMPYKALFQDTTLNYSYDKYQFGSYRDVIPSKYAMGFLRLSAAPKAGNVAGVFEDITRNPLRYNKAYRESLGLGVRDLWSNARTVYNDFWREEDSLKSPFDEPEPVSAKERRYVSYSYPVALHGRLFAVRSARGDNTEVVEILHNSYDKCCLAGNINGTMSGQGHMLYWTETVSSGRWEHESFSVLSCYNIEQGKRHILSHKTRYFNASVSADGKQVAMAEYLTDGTSRVVLYLPEINMFHIAMAFPFGFQLKEMAWIDNQHLIATVQMDEGLAIYKIDLEQKTFVQVIPPQQHSLRRLTVSGGKWLLFDSDMDGTDNLYALDLNSSKLHRLTNAHYGAFQPYIEDGVLYYTNYSTAGYEVVRNNFDAESSPMAFWGQGSAAFFDRKNCSEPDSVDNAPNKLSYEVKRYSKFSHLFRVHSWAPLYYDKDELSSFSMSRYYDAVALGAVLMTQNDLGTAYGQAGYSYHDGHHAAHAKFTYTGWYPVISLSAHYNTRDAYEIISAGDTLYQGNSWRNSIETQLTTYIPFSFSAAGWHHQIVPSLTWSFTNDSYKAEPDEAFYRNILRVAFQWNSYRAMTSCDLLPRWGLGFSARYFTFLGQKRSLFTDVLYADARVYLPGFFKNHSICLKGACQNQIIPDNVRMVYYLSNQLTIRGLKDVLYPQMTALTFDYAFPVNIDLSIPCVLYVKRLEITPFVDFLYAENNYSYVKSSQSFLTVGVEALANFHPLRMTCSLSAGLRANYSIQQGSSFEFLLSVPYM